MGSDLCVTGRLKVFGIQIADTQHFTRSLINYSSNVYGYLRNGITDWRFLDGVKF